MKDLPNEHGPESPSLAPPGDGGALAYELKFQLSPAVAAAVTAWAQSRLTFDPNGDPALGGAYHTTTLYSDTPDLDVYHRATSYRRTKFRVRRYGLTSWVHLERKSKRGDRVTKRRSVVPESEVALLANPLSLETWCGHWFHQRVQAKRLRPACRVAYLRSAFVGSCPEGPLRLTLDRDIRGVLCDDWRLATVEGGLTLLPGVVIMELKFLRSLPLPFKELVNRLGLSPAPLSKYRLCREAWGLPSAEGEAARA